MILKWENSIVMGIYPITVKLVCLIPTLAQMPPNLSRYANILCECSPDLSTLRYSLSAYRHTLCTTICNLLVFYVSFLLHKTITTTFAISYISNTSTPTFVFSSRASCSSWLKISPNFTLIASSGLPDLSAVIHRLAP